MLAEFLYYEMPRLSIVQFRTALDKPGGGKMK
jgi:hypothetical protein